MRIVDPYRDARRAAYRFTTFEHAGVTPGTHGHVTVMKASVRSGLAVPVLTRGVVHRVTEAVIVNDKLSSYLAARYACGAASANAQAITADEASGLRPCERCDLAATAPAGPLVYRCYDAAGELVYIGSSINVAGRITSHRAVTPWWGDVARVDFEPHETEGAARFAESVAIFREHPLHNKAGRAAS